MGLHREGLSKRDVDALNDVARTHFGVGIGVIVQELEKHERLWASLEREQVRWWDLARKITRRGEMKRERVLIELWLGRLKHCTRTVADSIPTDDLAARRRAR